MAKYLVTMTLYQTCVVEADNEDEAREMANFEGKWSDPEPDGPFYIDLLEAGDIDAEIDASALAHEAATNSE